MFSTKLLGLLSVIEKVPNNKQNTQNKIPAINVPDIITPTYRKININNETPTKAGIRITPINLATAMISESLF